jgi:catalase
VLYDAVAVIAAPGGARALATNPAARDFLADAYAHCKFIGYTGGAAPLFEAAGLELDGDAVAHDGGIVSLDSRAATDFIIGCRQLRFWDRQRVTVV